MPLPSNRKAPPGSTCPSCGFDVGGFRLGRTTDGRRTWDQPFAWIRGQNGSEFASGGLTHVEGGRRCRRPDEGPVPPVGALTA